jgi:hypothetical protein
VQESSWVSVVESDMGLTGGQADLSSPVTVKRESGTRSCELVRHHELLLSGLRQQIGTAVVAAAELLNDRPDLLTLLDDRLDGLLDIRHAPYERIADIKYHMWRLVEICETLKVEGRLGDSMQEAKKILTWLE